jgi:tRNA(Ile)-lysidine synthase
VSFRRSSELPPLLAEAEFSHLMEAIGPFETAPRLCIAVSGGRDSMALVILADTWARRLGGQVTALTVDHGLRPNSAADAGRVGAWLRERGIDHHLLTWPGTKPTTGIQAAARRARYDLMTAWCRDAGILHLVVAHHQDDQAETYLMRLARGSGEDGLACMAAVVETPDVRLLRPLLAVPRSRLTATLKALGQPWLEDPSNHDPAFARVRVRADLAVARKSGRRSAGWAAEAGRRGRRRMLREAAVSALLARCCVVYPAGYAVIDGTLATAPVEISLAALSRIVLCIGGRDYGPRRDRLLRLHGRLLDGRLRRGATLGGCRILAAGGAVGKLLVCRETRDPPLPLDVRPGTEVLWDGRFQIAVRSAARLERLGRHGWAEVVGHRPDLRQNPVPAAVRPTLPTVADKAGIRAVPHIGYRREGEGGTADEIGHVAFHPRHSLSPGGFLVA